MSTRGKESEYEDIHKSRQREEKAGHEPSDYEKHYAVHADPNRERWTGGLTDPLGEPTEPEKPPEEIGGGVNAPKATGLNPAGCLMDDPDLLLVVHGLNFTAETLIVFDGVPIVTNYESEIKLNCELRPSAFVEARGYPVTVQQGRFVAPVATMFTVKEPDEADMFKAPTSPGRKKGK